MFSPIRFLKRAHLASTQPGTLGAALVKGAIGTAGLKVASAGIAFLTSIVLAKSLGPAGYGIFSYVIALVAVLAIPSELGIPSLAVREIAVANARKDWPRMRGFIQWSHRTVVITCACLVLSSAAALSLWGDRFGSTQRTCMWMALILVPLVSLGALRDAMLRGLRKVLLGQLCQPFLRPLFLLVALVALTLIGQDLHSPVLVMSLHITSVALAFMVGLGLYLANRPPELRGVRPTYDSSSWLRSCIPFGMTAALQLINGRTDILALGFFQPDAHVGIYRVASQIAALVIFGMQAVAVIQGPHIANLFAKGDMQKLQQLMTRSSQAILLIAVPAVVVIVLFGQVLIRFVYGPAYGDAYVPLVILCVGQLVNASMGSVASLLNMTGHERETTKSVLVGAIVNLTLNITLVPTWGMTGAAVATASTLIVWNLIMWHKARRLVGIETSPIFRRRQE